jgi:hypothetical protein
MAIEARNKAGARLPEKKAKEAEVSRQAAITALDKNMEIEIVGDVLSIGNLGGVLVVS